MKRLIILFLILFSFLAIFSNSSQLPQNAHQDSITSHSVTPSVDRSTSDVIKTNNSNSTHNNMTSFIAIAVALIAVAVALIGQHKSNQVDQIKKDFDSLRNDELQSIQNELHGLNHSLEIEKQLTARLSQVLQRNNESLYNSFKIVVKENKSFNLSKIIMLNYHINRLYISCLCYDNETATSIDLFDTFSYLKENGRKEDIKHLDYVSQNHPNETNRKLARDVIGNIQGRPDSSVPII